jgi:hypothetical protein
VGRRRGYFLGPVTGLEGMDLSTVSPLPQADALMIARSMLRSSVPARRWQADRAARTATGAC